MCQLARDKGQNHPTLLARRSSVTITSHIAIHFKRLVLTSLTVYAALDESTS